MGENTTGVFADRQSVINISPNPTTGRVFIQYGLESTSKLYLVIKDLLGQDVFLKEIEVNTKGYEEIDLSKYPKGIYFVNISKLNNSNENDLSDINSFKLVLE